MAWSAAVATGCPALLLVLPELWVAGAVAIVSSAAFGVLDVAAAGLRYRLVPGALLGRVSAARRTSAYAASAVGALAGGLAASSHGTSAPFVLSVAVGAVATWWWLGASRPAPA